MNRIYKSIITFSSAILLSLGSTFGVFAETQLPEGSVKGMPEDLIVMDDSGNSVSESGEYFFLAEDMTPLETYSKKIQIMNLRDDKTYHIYFYAEPIDSSGDIDLENTCQAEMTIDGKTCFTGKINGTADDGSVIDQSNPIDLGEYKPGDSKIMNFSVTWMDVGKGYSIDNGSRLVDVNGTHILKEADTKKHIEGESTFKWVFYAQVDKDPEVVTTSPKTGFLYNDYFMAALTGELTAAVIALSIAVKRKQKKNDSASS